MKPKREIESLNGCRTQRLRSRMQGQRRMKEDESWTEAETHSEREQWRQRDRLENIQR